MLKYFCLVTWLLGYLATFSHATSYDFNATTTVYKLDPLPAALQLNTGCYLCWTYREGDGEGSTGRLWADDAGSTGLRYLVGATTYSLVAPWSTTNGQWTIAKPAQDAWVHNAVCYNGGATTNDPDIFVDSVLQAETEVATPVGTHGAPTGTLSWGNNNAVSATWDGKIADCARYSAFLSANQIKQIMYFGPESIKANLVGYWPLGSFGVTNLTTTAGLDATHNTATTVSNIGPPRITPQGTGLLGIE